MSSEAPPPRPVNDPLPPVHPPPSASHIFKQFIVPLLIVGGLVGVFVLASSLFPGCSVFRTPDDFLNRLRSDNPDVRWRTAQDLAQVLLRDDRLASDPRFGLELVGTLDQVLDRGEEIQQQIDEKQKADPQADVAKLQQEAETNRQYATYLAACLANLSTPVGVPVLKDLAREEGVGSERDRTRLRWQALWALANLGENLKRFDKLSSERQTEILAALQDEMSAEGQRGTTAALALGYLKDRQAGEPNTLGVDEVLVQASTDPNPFLREVAVFAMNFWEGTPEANRRMEEALQARLEDRGQGQELLNPFYDDNEKRERTFTRTPGLTIRYNAAVALARKGSSQVPLDILQQMLEESFQLEEHRLKPVEGPERGDEATAYDTIRTALRAVAALHRKNPQVNVTALKPAIEKLKQSQNASVQAEAERTLQVLAGE